MENNMLSLVDEIHAELVNGLKIGLDWTHFLAKHGAHKGALYNAIGRFFNDMEPKVRALNEVQGRLDEAGLKLDQLNQEIKDAGVNAVRLKDTEAALGKQIEALQAKLAEKKELVATLAEIEKLGFNVEMLGQLKDILVEIGAKNGLKGKEVANKFFDTLKDYDTRLGFEREIQRLGKIIETKRLEAENWQAKTEKLESQYRNLKEATDAMQDLLKREVKAEQIISWNAIVNMLGGPAQLQDRLGEYKSMFQLLAAKQREIEACNKKATELAAQIKVLTGQKAEIEGAIKSLSGSGTKRITDVRDKAVAGLNSVSTSGLKHMAEARDKGVVELRTVSAAGVKEITGVSGIVVGELKSLSDEIRVETKRMGDLKVESGKLEKELMHTRYFFAGDEALKAFPKEVAVAFLKRTLSYCKLNQVNPMVRVPEGFHDRYPSIYSTTHLGLLDLITWAEIGLAGALK